MSDRSFSFKRRWLEVLLAVLLVGWIGWRMAGSPPSPNIAPPDTGATSVTREPIATSDLLIRKFDLTAFREGTERNQGKVSDYAYKWDTSVRLGLYGKDIARYRDHINGLVVDLSRLTGLRVSVAEANGVNPPNVYVHLASPKEADILLRDYSPKSRFAEGSKKYACIASIWDKDALIFKAFAIIKNNLGQKIIRHCIIEEITHLMGLFGHTDIVHPSAFDHNGPAMVWFPINDKILVRTLYDSRITPGMTREEAMKIVREIIPELVEQVRARGVEALYQR